MAIGDFSTDNFSATVISSEKTSEGVFRVVLDNTDFFPEMGGQYADEGTINGFFVKTVQKEKADNGNFVVAHYILCDETDNAPKTGDAVECKIDSQKRFDRKQNHTGEHIVSGLLKKYYGSENVGFHLSDTEMTLDTSKPLTKEQLSFIEVEANKAVWQNVPVTIIYPSKDELENYDYRSKLELSENVRLVKIGDWDLCACCAPHVNFTGEIGCIKILKAMSYKGGMRLFLACGARATEDYIKKSDVTTELSQMLSKPWENLTEAVSDLQTKLSTAKNEVKNAQSLLAFEKIKQGGGFAIVPFGGDALLSAVNEYLKGDFNELCIVFGGNDNDGYFYTAAKKSGDISDITKLINSELSGRGGGRGNTATGKITAKQAQIEEFFDKNF